MVDEDVAIVRLEREPAADGGNVVEGCCECGKRAQVIGGVFKRQVRRDVFER